jgi:hypothetical protein
MRDKVSFAIKPTLHGERVTLRPVTIEDVAGLVELVSDPQVRRPPGTHRVSGLNEAEDWYRTRATHHVNGKRIAVAGAASPGCAAIP